MFALTFLLVAALETTVDKDEIQSKNLKAEDHEEYDMCVGCEDKKDDKKENSPHELEVEVSVDPETGKVFYVIKGLVIE